MNIFAERAKTKASKLQIELAYLKYVKSRLSRGGHMDFGSISSRFKNVRTYFQIFNDFSEFTPDFEIVSGKQSAKKGAVGGSGETQLEIEKRKISSREAQIKEELTSLKQRRQVEAQSRKSTSLSMPTVALVGYTNSGKTALMNRLTKSGLSSENKLFETLSTTIKKYI